jgi:hypothetical protein
MKMPYQPVVFIMALAIASSACQRSSRTENTKPDHEAASSNTTTKGETGKPAKWPMPEAMMKHIRNLEQDVSALESSAEKDHAGLATQIDEHTKQLITSCTMDGEAHDALHDWLMPFLRLNKEYAAAPDAVSKSAKFTAIQESLAAFHERFE